MNKVERVRAALAGEKVDRVPASFWFHFTPGQASRQGVRPGASGLSTGNRMWIS